MESFTRLTGVAAPLPMINVDTDMIIPKQFLKTIKRTGLGQSLFFEMRYDDNGAPIENFVLNQAPFRAARILIAGDNFGCGSSREHAPWALLDFGIRCIIAPSFADIFYNNCFKNGILPVVLTKPDVDQLMAWVSKNTGTKLTVDLEQQVVQRGNSGEYRFEIDPFRKHCLLHGLDDIGMTLEKVAQIDSFEAQQKMTQPWLIS
ncbi:MAG: 3-isopropylmalate dehydratase small subunit [Hyphomicrobiales bacterium]|nr:3-isopropylmalate dehydratase small subunit [Hyphomicrobiales bacterium]